MKEYVLGQDKITCPIDVVDGVILIDGGVKFTLRQGTGNALNAKTFSAFNEKGERHPDLVDQGRSDVIHYTMDRAKTKRTWMHI